MLLPLSNLSFVYDVFQVMASTPRSDIYINLPALQKLDMMLIVRQVLFSNLTLLCPFVFAISKICAFFKTHSLASAGFSTFSNDTLFTIWFKNALLIAIPNSLRHSNTIFSHSL